MTAIKFLNYAHVDDMERNLSYLTAYLDSSIDFSQFPDAEIPDSAWEDADEPYNFQNYLDQQYGDETKVFPNREGEEYQFRMILGTLHIFTQGNCAPEWLEATCYVLEKCGFDPEDLVDIF